MRTRRPRRWPLAVAALLAVVAGCDIGGAGGCGGGCASVHQGDYQMPVKRIVRESVAVRLTQPGMDFVSARIKALVLSFFDADAHGRALIPLAALGLGNLGTSLGPLDASVRDVVLAVDLADLDVRFVPGSAPPRIQIVITDAIVGIESGRLAGGIDAFLFQGDVACGLADGPSGRVARLDLDLRLQLATTPQGGMDVTVLPSTINLYDVAIELTTDCSLPECLDGLSPPTESECFECQTICPVADIAADLAESLRDLFDDLVDGLLNLLADDLANLILDGFLNGRPLAVEGTLDVAGLLGPLVRYLESARPLGLLARPAGDAFAITGAGPSLGLDLILDAGVDAAPAHPCAANAGADPSYVAGPRPTFDGLIAHPNGALVPYDLGLGISDAVVNEAIWALYKAGALCIDLTTADIAELTRGGLVITARTLDLLLPGLTRIAGPDAPVRIRIRPTIGQANPSPLRFVAGATPTDAVAELDLGPTEIAIDVLVGDHFMRMVGFRADVRVRLGLDALPGAQLGLRIDDIDLGDLTLPQNELFTEARLDLVAPFVVDLALGFLSSQPIALELGTSGLGEALGVPLNPVIIDLRPAGPQGDWLAIHLRFDDPAAASGGEGVTP